PPMSNPIYREGGRLYWRVAAVDADNNTGDFTGSQQLIRAQVMRLRALGVPARRRRTQVTIIATDRLGPVSRARVRVSGAGIRAQTKLTGATGRVGFSILARRRGTISVLATKAGYDPARLVLPVR
ncbi:MAG: hypothetical protein ICV74_10510, partial [Thermoleophilia bacterium]|nr:hypothetical protein [Thermoleophilia bacterium]